MTAHRAALRRCAALEVGSEEYDAAYRRYLASETFLGAVVLLTIFAMAAKPFS